MASDPRTLLDAYASGISGLSTTEDAAPEAIAALRAVLDLHKPFHIYHECDHGDREEHTGTVVEVDEIGPSCDDGYQYSICAECCTGRSQEYQTEECVEHHRSQARRFCWPCPTAISITTALQGGQQ